MKTPYHSQWRDRTGFYRFPFYALAGTRSAEYKFSITALPDCQAMTEQLTETLLSRSSALSDGRQVFDLEFTRIRRHFFKVPIEKQ
jgi:hypothetical protein